MILEPEAIVLFIGLIVGLLLGVLLGFYLVSRTRRWTFRGAWKLATTNIFQTTHHGDFSFVTPPEWNWEVPREPYE